MSSSIVRTFVRAAGLLALSTLPLTAWSQSYQYELTADFSSSEIATDELELLTLSAEIFFEEVHIGSHPYAEAAFLEKASSLVLAYFDAEFTTTGASQDTTGILILANYVVPDSSLILEAGYTTTDGDATGGTNVDGDILILGIGSYINDNASLRLELVDTEIDITGTGGPANLESTDIALSFKLVAQSGDGSASNFELSFTSSKAESGSLSETNTIIAMDFDYYLNQAASVGVMLAGNTGDDLGAEGTALGVNTRVFFTPAFAVYAEFSRFDADFFVEDEDTLTFGALARF